MIVAVGSTNTVKVQAVVEVLQNYPQLALAQVKSFSVPSEVSAQPLTLEETIRGAKMRATNAFIQCPGCTYSFGIESGLFEAPGSSTGFLEACVTAIYDGVVHHIGLSSGFEVPPHILKRVLEDNMDLAQACFDSGITKNPQLGSAEGLVGLLTNNRLSRKEYTKQSVVTALIRVEHATLYTGLPSLNAF